MIHLRNWLAEHPAVAVAILGGLAVFYAYQSMSYMLDGLNRTDWRGAIGGPRWLS